MRDQALVLYPDCRDDALKALQVSLSLGMDTRFTIETPLMWIDKAQTFALAEELAASRCSRSSASTPTCYLGSREPHDWVPGCGECPACKLRKDGWSRYRSSKAERRTA